MRPTQCHRRGKTKRRPLTEAANRLPPGANSCPQRSICFQGSQSSSSVTATHASQMSQPLFLFFMSSSPPHLSSGHSSCCFMQRRRFYFFKNVLFSSCSLFLLQSSSQDDATARWDTRSGLCSRSNAPPRRWDTWRTHCFLSSSCRLCRSFLLL